MQMSRLLKKLFLFHSLPMNKKNYCQEVNKVIFSNKYLRRIEKYLYLNPFYLQKQR